MSGPRLRATWPALSSSPLLQSPPPSPGRPSQRRSNGAGTMSRSTARTAKISAGSRAGSSPQPAVSRRGRSPGASPQGVSCGAPSTQHWKPPLNSSDMRTELAAFQEQMPEPATKRKGPRDFAARAKPA